MIILVPVEEGGYEVQGGHSWLGWIYPDSIEGWRPYTYYGRCATRGQKAHESIEAIIYEWEGSDVQIRTLEAGT